MSWASAYERVHNPLLPARLAHLLACLNLHSGVCKFIPGSSTFFHKLSVTGERVSIEYWLTTEVKPAQEKCN